MPEGDTVFRLARRMHTALAGQAITRCELRVPRVATVDLRGGTVREVLSRGKHLLMRIDTLGSGALTLHSHLRMDGAWHLRSAGDPRRYPESRVRAIIGTASVEAVGLDLALLDVVPAAEEHRLVGHLGPDPLSADWDRDEALRRLAADPRPIHIALLDQRSVAGFGNEYAAELLFLRGILPHRPASETELAALLDLGVRTIRANRDRSPRTFTGNSRPGERAWVYGRAGRPCRRCGTPIRTGMLGARAGEERVLFWCPRCQA